MSNSSNKDSVGTIEFSTVSALAIWRAEILGAMRRWGHVSACFVRL